MKWYHFGLIFLLVFGGLFILEQQEEITTRLWENSCQVEYDCLVAAVNAATQVYFEGKGTEAEERLLEKTAEAFFQTLSFLHEKNPDEAGRMKQKEMVPVMAVFDEEGFFLYRRESGTVYGWSARYDYLSGGEIPEEFFHMTGELIAQNIASAGDKRKLKFSRGFEGTWEKALSPGCVFAAYVPEAVELSRNGRKNVIYAASKISKERFLVTKDMVCHLVGCEGISPEDVLTEFLSQKAAASYGATPCEFCLLWESEEDVSR